MADVTRVPKSEMVDMVQKSFSSLAGKDITKKDAEAALNAAQSRSRSDLHARGAIRSRVRRLIFLHPRRRRLKCLPR